MMELDATTFFHLQRPYKYGGNPCLTKIKKENGDGEQPHETSSNIHLGTVGGKGEAEQRGYLFPHMDCIRKSELLWLMKPIQMMLGPLL